MSDMPVIKHPISYEEAEAFAKKYINAPPEVHEAAFYFLCDFEGTDGLEEVHAKAESAHRISDAMNRLVGKPIEPLTGEGVTDDELRAVMRAWKKRHERKTA